MPLIESALPTKPDMAERHRRYWRQTRRLVLVLLALWVLVSFVLTYFARELSFSFFGWPFSFWVAAQGALLVYVLLIWCHTWVMNRLDRRYREDPVAQDAGD
jgi:putative solute:sodium symporter small subunit